MRSDFGRVVIERERTGSSSRNLKMRKTGRFRLDSADWQDWDYDGPLLIRTSGRSSRGWKHSYDKNLGEKNFTDVLRPVYGYLHKSIGRQWDDVFSEVTRELGRRGHALSHILDQHLLYEVDRNTYYENGKVWSHGRPHSSGRYFVCPLTGVLKCEPERRRRYVRRGKEVTHRLPIGDGRWYVFAPNRRGQFNWYIGTYQHPSIDTARYFHRPQEWPDCGGEHFRKERQAGKKDLKLIRAKQDAEIAKLR